MPKKYPLYTNSRIMEAEAKILKYFELNKYTPVSAEFLMKLTGETQRNVENAISQIRKYKGYKVETCKKGGGFTYHVIYQESKDPWRFLFNVN